MGTVNKSSTYSLLGTLSLYYCVFLGCMIYLYVFVLFTLDSLVSFLHVLTLV